MGSQTSSTGNSPQLILLHVPTAHAGEAIRLARQLGLPLDHPVEVWLRGNIRLIGMLRLREETLFIEEQPDRELELEVDGVPFTAGEMESCVRTN